MRVLVCADKFRGTATAREVGEAVAGVVAVGGGETIVQPMADGGEGTLDAFGGPNRRTTVTGPLGDPVEAAWSVRDGVAVIEMARASGLMVAGGPEANDPVEATTTGEEDETCVHRVRAKLFRLEVRESAPALRAFPPVPT